MANKINIGDTVEIIFYRKAYITKVENIIDDMTFVVGTPIVHNSYVYIPLYMNVMIRYITNSGIYQFDGKVIRKESNIIHLLTIIQTGPKENFQRRKSYRLQTAILASFFKQDNINQKCIIKDISSGGARLSTYYKLNINDRIILNFALKGFGNFSVKGIVIRVRSHDLDYDAGISFEDLSYAEKEKIVGFVFQEQRKLIRKGLII